MNTDIIVALDFSDFSKAADLVTDLSDTVDFYKVGLEAFISCGEKLIHFLKSNDKKVFLDLKFHDIPNTVASASLACLKYDIDMLNVHAQGGSQMMSTVSTEINQHCSKYNLQKPYLIAVTLLTSLNDDHLKEYKINAKNTLEYVVDLAKITQKSGFDGVVASAIEVSAIKNTLGDDFLTVTPGIRPAWSVKNDQQRVVRPSEASKLNCDYIVIGRPITANSKPYEAAEKILEELND